MIDEMVVSRQTPECVPDLFCMRNGINCERCYIRYLPILHCIFQTVQLEINYSNKLYLRSAQSRFSCLCFYKHHRIFNKTLLVALEKSRQVIHVINQQHLYKTTLLYPI